jgi:hypothetical protein
MRLSTEVTIAGRAARRARGAVDCNGSTVFAFAITTVQFNRFAVRGIPHYPIKRFTFSMKRSQ